MAKVKWEPAVFHEACEKLPVRDQRRLWDDLKPEQKKLLFEWKTFQAFARISGLDIDLRRRAVSCLRSTRILRAW